MILTRACCIRLRSSLAITVLFCCTVANASADGPGPARRLLTGTWNPTLPKEPTAPCARTTVSTAGFQTVWVDANAPEPGNGTQQSPYKTVGPAVAAIPKFTRLTQGIVINIMPGIVYNSRNASLWIEGVWGTARAPVVFQRAPGTVGEADMQSINVFNSTYLYFRNVTFRQPADSFGGGDVVHFAHCDYIYLLGVTAVGQPGDLLPQETVKVNQVQGMYIEDCDISFAGDNAVDFVAVQYGHICRTKMHDANWCIYTKGGSGYLLLDSNSIYNCRESGLSIGQGTGFEYMVPPWIQYEAYSVRVINNILHDVWGAALGVEGGYNVLMAYNTVFRAGSRSHIVEFLYGSRSCDGDTDLLGTCSRNANAGGWGPRQGMPAIPIPNRNVFFMNNLIVNPTDNTSQWSHFSAPTAPGDDTPGPLPSTPNPTVANGLRIRGNIIINQRPPGDDRGVLDLGLSACTSSNPTCNPAQVARENTITQPGVSVTFSDSSSLTLTPADRPRVKALWKRAALPAFPGWSTPGFSTPSGSLANSVGLDCRGAVRKGSSDFPGATVYLPRKNRLLP